MKARVFFENFVERRADLLLVLTRFRLDGKRDGSLRIFNRVVDDGRVLVCQSVAGLRLFELDDGDDVSGARLVNLVELFALHRMKRAESFGSAARRVLDGRVGL